MPPESSPKQNIPRTPVLHAAVRCFMLVLAVLSLALAVVGLFLPVLPTVPFLLLAAWAAGHSSPRLLHWLESHPRFGAQITDWRRAGVVRRRAKWTATFVMSASAITTLLLLRPHWVALTTVAVMACVLAWLWLRPEQETQ
ncbi:MAG: YbaN family protein [Polaromonas sp.]